MKRRSFFGLLLAPIALPLLKLVEWVKPKPKGSAWEKIVDSYEADRRGCVRGNTTNNADLYFMDRNGMWVLRQDQAIARLHQYRDECDRRFIACMRGE